MLRPRWGATEGGLDRLGWVRQVLGRIEELPLYQAHQPEREQVGAYQKWEFFFNKVGPPACRDAMLETLACPQRTPCMYPDNHCGHQPSTTPRAYLGTCTIE